MNPARLARAGRGKTIWNIAAAASISLAPPRNKSIAPVLP
jgi:hypothetical protein